MNQSNAGIHPPPRRPDSGSTFANIFPIRGFNALCCALSLEGLVIVYIFYVDYHLRCQSWPWTEIFLVLPNEWMQTLTFVPTLFNSKGFLCLWRCCSSCSSFLFLTNLNIPIAPQYDEDDCGFPPQENSSQRLGWEVPSNGVAGGLLWAKALFHHQY